MKADPSAAQTFLVLKKKLFCQNFPLIKKKFEIFSYFRKDPVPLPKHSFTNDFSWYRKKTLA